MVPFAYASRDDIIRIYDISNKKKRLHDLLLRDQCNINNTIIRFTFRLNYRWNTSMIQNWPLIGKLLVNSWSYLHLRKDESVQTSFVRWSWGRLWTVMNTGGIMYNVWWIRDEMYPQKKIVPNLQILVLRMMRELVVNKFVWCPGW